MSDSKNNDSYIIGWYKNNKTDLRNFYMQVSCFLSVDVFIDNPTEEEYKIIANSAIRTYCIDDNNLDIRYIADIFARKYSEGEISLESLDSMSKWDLYDMVNEEPDLVMNL